MFGKRSAALMAAVLSIAAVTGCSGGGSTTASDAVAKTKITYYGGWTGADLDKMKGLVDTYNKSQTKVEVEFSSLQWTNMFTKFLADYQAGNSPDVVAMHTFEIGQFANMKVLDTEAVKSLNLKKDDYLPIAWDGTQLGGAMYGVPLDVNMHAVYYNKDMFKAAGLTDVPKDKDAFIKAAQALTIDANGNHPDSPKFDGKNVKQYGLGFAMNHHSFYQMYALMNQMGYNPFTADMTSVSLDKAKVGAAVQFMEDLIFKYKVVPVGEKSPTDDIKAGKVAMSIDGNWQLSGFSDVKFDWGTAEYPQFFDQKAVWGASELLAFPKKDDAKKLTAAKSFVTWLANNSAEWAKSGQIPANQTAFKTMTKLKGIDAFIAELDHVKFVPASPKATKVFSSAAPSPILTFAQDTVLNNKPAAGIVTQFESGVNAALK